MSNRGVLLGAAVASFGAFLAFTVFYIVQFLLINIVCSYGSTCVTAAVTDPNYFGAGYLPTLALTSLALSAVFVAAAFREK